MADERSLVARRIEEIRVSKRLSRQQVADKLTTIDERQRWTRLQVWRLETGVTEVSADTAALFATALEVSVASLFRESKAAS